MQIFILSILLLSLSFYAVPAILSRLTKPEKITDQFVGAIPVSGQVFTNASVAYAIQMATFGPFFAWGAAGDLLPAMVNSAFFGLGLFLIYVFRRSILDFVSLSAEKSSSLTIHGYLSAAHGNSAAVRIISSTLTIVALWGLVTAEVIGTASIIRVLVGGDQTITYILMFGMLLLMFFYTILGGNRGVMQVDQVQLALAYLSLFGIIGLIAAFKMPLQASSEPYPILCVFILITCSVLILILRSGRFVDFSSDLIQDPAIGQSVRMRRLEQGYKLVQRYLNAIVVTVVVAATVSLIAFSIRVIPEVSIASVVTSSSQTNLSYIALVSLALLPLLYQIVDISNWQRIATLVRRNQSGRGEIDEVNFRSAYLNYAIEAPVLWVLLFAIGGLAILYVGPLATDDPFGDFARKLVTGGPSGSLLLGLLAVAVFAIALSTMDAVLSASLFAFRYDILPFLKRKQDTETTIAESRAVRSTSTFGIISYLVVFVAYVALDRFASFGTSAYLAMLIGFYTAQLAFVPLLFGALWSTRRKGHVSAVLTSSAAIGVLISGATTGLGITAAGLITGNEDLTWWAAPGCLLVSAGVFFIGLTVNSNKEKKSA